MPQTTPEAKTAMTDASGDYAVSAQSLLARQQSQRARQRRELGVLVLRYVALTVLGFFMMAPFLWLLTTSLKPEYQVFLFPPKWIPNPIMWSNYADVLTKVPFMRWFGNTLTITSLALLGTLISATTVAYGFARVQFDGKGFFFMLLVATMMLPDVVTMIPTFILFSKLKWINTFLPMIVPAWFGGTAFYIFLIRQYMTTLPLDLEEAATIDGASSPVVFVRIIVPLCKPVLGTVGIFSFIANWNDFMRPMLYLNTPEKKTMAVGLRYFQSQWGTEWGLMMAAAALMIAPVLVIYFGTQRYFVKGIAMTGIAGR